MKARALLVGINRYPSLTNLEGPENDVAAMETWLTSDAGGSLDPKKDIVKFTTYTCYPPPASLPASRVGAQPIMGQIYVWLDQLVEEGLALKGDFPLGDRLYLFFAGHGHHADGKTAVFMANAWANDLGQAIPMQQLSECVRSYAFFKEVILIADACREQIKFAADPYFSHKAKVSQNAGAVRQFDAFPCSVGQKTKETEFNGKAGGVLTNAFLTGVSGLAAQNGVVTSTSLKSYMINAVAGKLGQDPDIACSSEGKTFPVAAAVDRQTHLTVKRQEGAPAGPVTLVEGATKSPLVTQDLAVGPIERDLRPGWYILTRNGSADKMINVAWETTNAEY